MRTTLTLDDDLAALLRQQAARAGVSFKETVNRVLRSGLEREAPPHDVPVPRTIPHAFGFRPGIDLDKLNQLADELEAEELARSHGR